MKRFAFSRTVKIAATAILIAAPLAANAAWYPAAEVESHLAPHDQCEGKDNMVTWLGYCEINTGRPAPAPNQIFARMIVSLPSGTATYCPCPFVSQ